MTRSWRFILTFTSLIIAGVAISNVKPATATEFCHLKKTRDGYVALRSGPSTKSKLIAKMKPEDEVLVGLNQQGNWVDVTWWRGDDRLNKGYDKISGRGWMNRKLMEEEC